MSNNIQNKWNPNLSSEQLYVMKEKGTEAPHTGKYLDHDEIGVYHCANCDAPLYESKTKFNSGCGWPSFHKEIPGSLTRHTDTSHGMRRTEICCSSCGGHMGHVFKGEGFKSLFNSNARHCVNSVCLNFKKEKAKK